MKGRISEILEDILDKVIVETEATRWRNQQVSLRARRRQGGITFL
jgi:hypothetical protein